MRTADRAFGLLVLLALGSSALLIALLAALLPRGFALASGGSADVSSVVARKRRKSNRQSKKPWPRSTEKLVIRAASMRWMSCLTRSHIGWRFGGSLLRKSTTVAFLM